jgi:hypothetical protein
MVCSQISFQACASGKWRTTIQRADEDAVYSWTWSSHFRRNAIVCSASYSRPKEFRQRVVEIGVVEADADFPVERGCQMKILADRKNHKLISNSSPQWGLSRSSRKFHQDRFLNRGVLADSPSVLQHSD